MSTNYYLNDPKGATHHIGKSSGGWQFLFDTAEVKLNGMTQVVDSFDRWVEVIQTSLERFGWKIEDEYGREIPFVTLIARVMDSQKNGVNCWTSSEAQMGPSYARKSFDDGYFFDKRGFWFSTSRDFG